jgi:hypothetical protein
MKFGIFMGGILSQEIFKLVAAAAALLPRRSSYPAPPLAAAKETETKAAGPEE